MDCSVESDCNGISIPSQENSDEIRKLRENTLLRDILRKYAEQDDVPTGENQILKEAQAELARQVLNLLNEIEKVSADSSCENEHTVVSSDGSDQEKNSNKLVTLSVINILQEINQQLWSSYDAKISNYETGLKNLHDFQELQTQITLIFMQERDHYIKLYSESTQNDEVYSSLSAHLLSNDQSQLGDSNVSPESHSSFASAEAIAATDRIIQELKDKVSQLENLKQSQESYAEYKEKTLAREKHMTEQSASMQLELRNLISINANLESTVHNYMQENKTLQKTVATYKKQLSDRNKLFEILIIKYEDSISGLYHNLTQTQKKLISTEHELRTSMQQYRDLDSTEFCKQVQIECGMVAKQNDAVILHNLEQIKLSVERAEVEGKMRWDSTVNKLDRKCSRCLLEEGACFNELKSDFQTQTDFSKQFSERETLDDDKLGQQLAAARNDATETNKKAQEFKLKFDVACLDIQTLKKELIRSQDVSQQNRIMAERSEKALRDFQERYSESEDRAEKALEYLRNSYKDLKNRVNDLKTGVLMQSSNGQLRTKDKSAYVTKIYKLNYELRDLGEHTINLVAKLQAVEKRNGNEMISRYTDCQTLGKLKEDIIKKIMDQSSELIAAKQELDSNRQASLDTKMKTVDVDLFNELKQENIKISGETLKLKRLLLSKAEELQKANENMTRTEALLTQCKSEEIPTRKKAKRSEDSYLEVKYKLESETKIVVENPKAMGNIEAKQPRSLSATSITSSSFLNVPDSNEQTRGRKKQRNIEVYSSTNNYESSVGMTLRSKRAKLQPVTVSFQCVAEPDVIIGAVNAEDYDMRKLYEQEHHKCDAINILADHSVVEVHGSNEISSQCGSSLIIQRQNPSLES